MSYIKHTSSGTFQLCVVHRLLKKRLWLTFDTHEQAANYGQQLQSLLAQGIVPAELLEEQAKPKQETWLVARCIAEYVRNNSIPRSDLTHLDTVRQTLPPVRTDKLDYSWAEAWVRSMKREQNLAPSTIKHRQGALARCFDWMNRKHPEILAQNPLRLLKRGFAQYTPEDSAHVARTGGKVRVDTERDRRLSENEELAIRREFQARPEELMFFSLALDTAMRMRECYTITLAQVSLPMRTIFLDRTKNGDSRQVPLPTPTVAALHRYMTEQAGSIAEREGRLFPYWDGDRSVKVLDRTSLKVSALFARGFERAGIEGLHFHDLRHEATCRLYERTTLSDVLIARITGHRDIRTLKRYASMRGSDLAVQLR